MNPIANALVTSGSFMIADGILKTIKNKYLTKMKITDALIEVGSAGAGLLAAQGAENHLPGYAGPGVALAAGGAVMYFAPDGFKVGGAVLAGYGLLSAAKKLAFKANKRPTGLLAEVQDVMPGNLLPVAKTAAKKKGKGVKGLADYYLEEGMAGLGNIEEALAGFGNAGIEEALAGAGGGSMGNLSDLL